MPSIKLLNPVVMPVIVLLLLDAVISDTDFEPSDKVVSRNMPSSLLLCPDGISWPANDIVTFAGFPSAIWKAGDILRHTSSARSLSLAGDEVHSETKRLPSSGTSSKAIVALKFNKSTELDPADTGNSIAEGSMVSNVLISLSAAS